MESPFSFRGVRRPVLVPRDNVPGCYGENEDGFRFFLSVTLLAITRLIIAENVVIARENAVKNEENENNPGRTKKIRGTSFQNRKNRLK